MKLITGNNILSEIIEDLQEDCKTIDDYKSRLKEICQYGCVSGVVSSLTYYADTIKFHDRHEGEIWDTIYEYAENEGISVLEYINQLNGSKNVGDMGQFKNLLAWFSYEDKAFELMERIDCDETFMDELKSFIEEKTDKELVLNN